MEVEDFELNNKLLRGNRKMDAKNTDFISSLPIEIVQKIFNYLDTPSLVAAARANDNWRNIIEGNEELKRKFRGGLLTEEESSIFLKIALCYLFFLAITCVIGEAVNVSFK